MPGYNCPFNVQYSGLKMLLKQNEYTQMINICNEKITSLPAGEIKFYLFILINSIKNSNSQMTDEFINELSELLVNLNALHHQDSIKPDIFVEIFKNYERLQTIAQTNTLSAQIKNGLLQAGSAILSFLTAILGGVIGGIAGFVRGIWNQDPLEGLWVGVVTGYLIGAIFGFRSPKKLLKDELTRQIQFGLNGLHTCLENMQQSFKGEHEAIKPFNDYLAAEKIRVRKEYFTNDTDFELFLKSDITYEINSYKATFISPTLAGYLGQHLYIAIKINEVGHLIEFNNESADTSIPPDQQERRTVKGSKIIEMLATFQKLQETVPCTPHYIATRMKPADNDCHTLINKVLLGTNQLATKLNRYADTNNLGSMIGFFMTKLSPFKEDFYNTPEPTMS